MTTNRLAQESSAYLHSAKHQPIEWYPWGTEAFQHAQTQDRPVLLDVGAVWCHWCHVIDTESYDDPTIAKFINDHFIKSLVSNKSRITNLISYPSFINHSIFNPQVSINGVLKSIH